MNNLPNIINAYLNFCQSQKRLDVKTLKAYRIDLKQYTDFASNDFEKSILSSTLEEYISTLHTNFKPKTAKRKIASLKAFFRYLEYKDLITLNPFNKIHTKFREPKTLPKTIPLYTIEAFLSTLYKQINFSKTAFQKKCALRDIAVIELLFATGMRISELCSLKPENIDLISGNIDIYGKGAKERKIQVSNPDVLRALNSYYLEFYESIKECGYFFTNRLGHRLSEQSVREMINKYAELANIEQHITPHMFRHTYATTLVAAGANVKDVQELLGHSDIKITLNTYSHVTRQTRKRAVGIFENAIKTGA